VVFIFCIFYNFVKEILDRQPQKPF